MRRSIKERLEDRGYRVVVGKAKFNRVLDVDNENWESADIDASDTMNARYIVKVSERRERFAWYWCPLNGFWWWNFNISIADQKNWSGINDLAWAWLRKQQSAKNWIMSWMSLRQNKDFICDVKNRPAWFNNYAGL